MKTVIICLIIIAVIIIAFFITSLSLATFIMSVKKQTLDEAFNWQSAHYDTAFYDEVSKTDYTVEGYQGYTLNVQFLKNNTPTDKYVIISHGYTDNRMGSLKYAKVYLSLGYNCVIYDLRGHGLNEKHNATYGIEESKDLIALVRDTKERYKDISVLGIHGESLGAATTVTSLKYHPDIDFAVADCGFESLRNVLENGTKTPRFIVSMAGLGIRMKYRYKLDDMTPITALEDNHIPILFIHGEADTFIIPQNSKDMYEKTKGVKEIHIVPDATHAASVIVAPTEYEEYVRTFLDKIIDKK